MTDPLLVLAGFLVALVLTPAGISGAFLLVPFQTSVLGLASVSVTPTNLLFNVVATPGAILAYHRSGRLDARLAGLLTLGSLPGVLVGVWLRLGAFSDPDRFRAVVGAVLAALAGTLLLDRRSADDELAVARDRRTDAAVLTAAAVVGVVGGIYGVGGGAFLAPFLAVATRRSLRRIAGATLVGTLATSVVGAGTFAAAAWWQGDASAAPDLRAGLLLGLGGLVGGQLGARLQPRVPERALRGVLTVAVGGLGLSYLWRWAAG